MREAIVSVRDPDGSALGLEAPLAVFREAGLDGVDVLSCEGHRGVVRVQVERPVEADRLEELPSVAWWERVAGSGASQAYLLEFDVREAPDMTGACVDDLLLCGAVDVDDGGFTFDVAGPQAAIAETVGAYEAAGADVRLETLREYEPDARPLDALTARQREVLEVAFEMGYFDVPRATPTADVAAELDLDASTVSEHLQRAERNLLSTVLAQPA